MFFFCGFILLCVRLSKNITKCLLFIIILFLYIFSIHFAVNQYLRKQTMEQQSHCACQRTKSNWPRFVLFHLAHKHGNGIIKGWLHCLTSESKGIFLVNNMLMFGSAWCLVMAQIQFSLIKKKDWTSRTLAYPLPSTSDNISFLPYPPPPNPPQSGCHMFITHNNIQILQICYFGYFGYGWYSWPHPNRSGVLFGPLKEVFLRTKH